MTHHSWLRLPAVGIALALCSAAPALAQSAPPAAEAATAAPPAGTVPTAAVVLSPFTINASKDVGFVAANSLAGGRLNTQLADTPAAYSVLTSEFIDALKLTDLESAMKWTVNSNPTPDQGSNAIFANQISGQDGAGYLETLRGVSAGQQQINFFPAFYDYDSYDIERFDFARGPNAILFGNGSFGGTPEATFKQAEFGQAFQQVQLSYGSYRTARLTADVNQPLTDQLALRVNLLDSNGGTWRRRESERKLAGAFAIAYNPFKNTQITANADIGSFANNLAYSYISDDISGWDGKTTFAALSPTVPSTAAAAGVQRLGSATTQYPVFIPGEPSLGLINWANSYATLGGDATAGVTPVGGTVVPGATANFVGSPLLNSFDLPASTYNNAINGSQFRMPGANYAVILNTPDFREDYDNYQVAINQQVGQHLFLSAAANYTSGADTTDYTAARGINAVYIDLNSNLPTGAANPNFLVPYDESVRYLNLTSFVAHNYRADALLQFEHTRWGDFRLNTEAGLQQYITPRSQYTYVIQDPNVDPRLWASTELVRYRYYWNTTNLPENNLGTISYTNPTSGLTSSVPTGFVLDDTRPGNTSETLARFKYAQAVLNAQLFNNKLDLLISGRRDEYDEDTLSSLAYNGTGYGPNWNAETIVYKPVGPANYFTLPVTRPSLSSGFANFAAPFPAYQSDYSLPNVTGDINSYDIGAVVHVTDWFALFADQSETYNPPTAAPRVNGNVFAPLLSKGYDAGLKFTFLENRLVVTLTQYAANQTGVALPTGTQSLPFAIPGTLNNIINLTPVGDLNSADINKEGLAPVPAVYSDTATGHTQGHELEITANPLPGWRVLANYALPIATQGNAFADSRAYIAANTATLIKILNDGGVQVINNVASVNPAVPTSTEASPTNVATAATNWNNLQAINANFVTGFQKTQRSPNYSGNFYTDYTIQSGPLKSFRYGLGANYYGRQVIGFHGADTVPNPASPATTIVDPSANPYNPVYQNGYQDYTGVLGYTWKVDAHYSVVWALNVDNLLNYGKPLYYNTAQQPTGGNLATSGRTATPLDFYYVNPRNYTVTATIKF
jgi:outer membrane receptor protein involved in Fe transport